MNLLCKSSAFKRHIAVILHSLVKVSYIFRSVVLHSSPLRDTIFSHTFYETLGNISQSDNGNLSALPALYIYIYILSFKTNF